MTNSKEMLNKITAALYRIEPIPENIDALEPQDFLSLCKKSIFWFRGCSGFSKIKELIEKDQCTAADAISILQLARNNIAQHHNIEYIDELYTLLAYLKEHKEQNIEHVLPPIAFYTSDKNKIFVGYYIWKISSLYKNDNFPPAQIALMKHGKEALLSYFYSLNDIKLKQQFLNEACDPSTPLGKIFDAKRGIKGSIWERARDQLLRNAWEQNCLKPEIGEHCNLSKEALLTLFDRLNDNEASIFLQNANDPDTAIGRVFATKRGIHGSWGESSLQKLARKASERGINLGENPVIASAPVLAHAEIVTNHGFFSASLTPDNQALIDNNKNLKNELKK